MDARGRPHLSVAAQGLAAKGIWAMTRIYDLAVTGGGINGCGIARDAAGRGLSVLLAERGDLASATSSASSKLIHGGLRYLEHYEFRLVRSALREREILLRAAPHIIAPLRFVLPHVPDMRPAWMIRAGLFLYDHLGGRDILPGSHGLDLRKDVAGEPLKTQYGRGFEYSDCQVDDARLVILTALDARERGADVRTRHEMVHAECIDGLWRVRLKEREGGRETTIAARVLINAAGPWVSRVDGASHCGAPVRGRMRLVRGSHIVVPRLYDHGKAYILQNDDGRIVFAIPYQEDFTLIGTTDVDVSGPEEAHISQAEAQYLCDAVNRYLKTPIAPSDVVWSFAGIRPLYDDGESSAQETTRDYVLDLHDEGAPLLQVFGGKITTYRELAEDVLARIGRYFPAMKGGWTHDAALPGGDFPVFGFDELLAEFRAAVPFLPEAVARRVCHAYGTRARAIFSAASGLADLGRDFGAGLSELEVRHLMAHEWARTAGDVVWRRTKLGLWMDEARIRALDEWMKEEGRRQ